MPVDLEVDTVLVARYVDAKLMVDLDLFRAEQAEHVRIVYPNRSTRLVSISSFLCFFCKVFRWNSRPIKSLKDVSTWINRNGGEEPHHSKAL